MLKNRYQFYEIVIIKSSSDYQQLVGREGVIVSMCQDNGEWLYLVKLSEEEDDEYLIAENDLISTGKVIEGESFDHSEKRHIGFLKEKISVPDDFNHMCPSEIQAMFDQDE